MHSERFLAAAAGSRRICRTCAAESETGSCDTSAAGRRRDKIRHIKIMASEL